MSDRYVCEWEGPENPTRGLSERDAAAYWKAHCVAGDCKFALRPGGHIPDDIRVRWALLQGKVTGKKETPAHRKERDAIRTAWREWSGRTFAFGPLVIPETPDTSGDGDAIAA